MKAIRTASTRRKQRGAQVIRKAFKTGGPQKRQSLGIPMERSSNRRLNPTKEYRHRYAGRLSQRIICTGRRGCDSLRDQPTNPSEAHQEHNAGNPRQSLSAARVAGCFQQNEAAAGSKGRGNQVVCNTGDIRGLLKEMDSSPLGCLPADRHQSNGCRKLAQSSVLPRAISR